MSAGQKWLRCAAHLGECEEVDFEDLAEHRGIVRLKLPGRTHAGVVDHEVKRIKMSSQLFEQPLTLFFDRQIGRYRNDSRGVGSFGD